MKQNSLYSFAFLLTFLVLSGCSKESTTNHNTDKSLTPNETTSTDICVDKKVALFRKENGEGPLIRFDMLEEWKSECGEFETEKSSIQEPSSPKKIDGSNDNFMIGICIISPEETLLECKEATASNLDTFSSMYSEFHPDYMSINIVWGKQYYQTIPSHLRKKSIHKEFPITYTVNSKNGTVVTEIVGDSQCISKDIYSRIDDEIYKESISMSGNCTEIQKRGFIDSRNEGKKLIKYIRMR